MLSEDCTIWNYSVYRCYQYLIFTEVEDSYHFDWKNNYTLQEHWRKCCSLLNKCHSKGQTGFRYVISSIVASIVCERHCVQSGIAHFICLWPPYMHISFYFMYSRNVLSHVCLLKQILITLKFLHTLCLLLVLLKLFVYFWRRKRVWTKTCERGREEIKEFNDHPHKKLPMVTQDRCLGQRDLLGIVSDYGRMI